MGGNIGVIVRKKNGEQIGMSRWTNVMPYHFKNIDLYLNNFEKWYETFSSEWLAMKDDYEQNKHTGNYKHNMTSIYFPHGNFPDEYGIIVVDQLTKTIYSSQNYCSINSISFHNIWNRDDDNDENKQLLQSYLSNNLIKQIRFFDLEKKQFNIFYINGLTNSDIFNMLDEISDKKISNFSHSLLKNISKENFNFHSSSFLISSDWNFITYDDRCMGILKIKQQLDFNGFSFTNNENEKWKEYVSDHWIYYEDNFSDNPKFNEFKFLYNIVFGTPFHK